MRRFGSAVLAAGLVLGVNFIAHAQEPGWSGTVVAQGVERATIEKTDIRLRPYRPFHFYGNTVRRTYYRGNPVPTLRDMTAGMQALMSNQAPPPRAGF